MDSWIKKSIDEYVENHTEQSHFVMAILENNLQLAIARADELRLPQLKEIVQYVYNEIPGSCWGSRDDVKHWLNNKKGNNLWKK